MPYASLMELSLRLRNRRISSLEATEAMLDRIERLDKRLNAYVTVMAEDARAQARKADAELAAGFDRGPLHGIPVAIKDLLFTENAPTTAGSSFLGALNPRWNATVVERLNGAGAGHALQRATDFHTRHPALD